MQALDEKRYFITLVTLERFTSLKGRFVNVVVEYVVNVSSLSSSTASIKFYESRKKIDFDDDCDGVVRN